MSGSEIEDGFKNRCDENAGHKEIPAMPATCPAGGLAPAPSFVKKGRLGAAERPEKHRRKTQTETTLTTGGMESG